jgi:hypothetical protein
MFNLVALGIVLLNRKRRRLGVNIKNWHSQQTMEEKT